MSFIYKIGNGFFSGSNSAPTNPTLQTWYDALVVKPSAGLFNDLNTLLTGMSDDGNLSKLDLFAIIAGMETDEQRLKPLITKSGENMVTVSSPTLSVNGVQGNGTTSYINTKYSPLTDAVNVSQSSACGFTYVGTVGTSSNRAFYGNARILNFQTLASGANNSIGICNGAPASMVGITPTGYRAGYRIDDTNVTFFHGADLTTTAAQPSAVNLIEDMYICCRSANDGVGTPGLFSNAIIRLVGVGSGTVNHSLMRIRLNTFFTSRGL